MSRDKFCKLLLSDVLNFFIYISSIVLGSVYFIHAHSLTGLQIKTKLTVSGITKSPIMRQFIKYQAIKAIPSNQDVSRFKIK